MSARTTPIGTHRTKQTELPTKPKETLPAPQDLSPMLSQAAETIGNSKNRCQFSNETFTCKVKVTPAQRLSNSCKACNQIFCSAHRLLEDHNCPKKEERMAEKRKAETELTKPKQSHGIHNRGANGSGSAF